MKSKILAHIFCFLAALSISCEEAELRSVENRPSDSEEGVDGYLAEVEEPVKSGEAKIITLESTTIEIAEAGTNQDSVVRMRTLASPPEKSEAADIGSPLSDVIEVAFLDSGKEKIFGSSILNTEFKIRQVISQPSNIDDLKIIVITDPDTDAETTNILGPSAFEVTEDLELNLIANTSVQLEALFTYAIVWIVEAKSIPPTLIISSGSVISSTKNENPLTPGGTTSPDYSEPQLTIYFESKAELHVSAFKEDKKFYDYKLAAGDFTPVAVFRDGSVPDFVGFNVELSEMIIYSHVNANSWEETSFTTAAAYPNMVSAFAISDSETLIAAKGTSATDEIVVAKVNRQTGAVVEYDTSSTMNLSAVDALIGDGNNYHLLASLNPAPTFIIRSGLANDFQAINGGTDFDPDWTLGSERELLHNQPFLRPMTGNKLALAANWATSISTAVVLGTTEGREAEIFNLGPQKLDATAVLAVNAKDDIAVGRITIDEEFIETFEVFTKLDDETQFTSLGQSIIGLDGANNCNLSTYRVGIDNLGRIYAVYVAGGLDKKIFYQSYENGAWSDAVEVLAQLGDTCPTIRDFHISGTPSRGGIR